jgi:AraC-like DNA-binding protein
MIFETYIPSFPLSQFIECFIYYKDYKPAHSIDRFFPDGNVNVVFELSDFSNYIYDNETLKEKQTCKKVWFAGMRNNFITIPSCRDTEMFVINFLKGKAYPFLEMPVNELTDFVVDGELVMSNEILSIRDALLNIPMVREKFAYTEKQLLKLYGNKLFVNPFVDFAVNQILQTPHQTTIQYLSGKIGYSQKHLIKIFREHVGLTPKSFLKIIRFQKTIGEIEKNRKANWTSVAYECGYYDQAHFINDFKHFSGFTPTQYLQTQSEYTNYVAVS